MVKLVKISILKVVYIKIAFKNVNTAIVTLPIMETMCALNQKYSK